MRLQSGVLKPITSLATSAGVSALTNRERRRHSSTPWQQLFCSPRGKADSRLLRTCPPSLDQAPRLRSLSKLLRGEDASARADLLVAAASAEGGLRVWKAGGLRQAQPLSTLPSPGDACTALVFVSETVLAAAFASGALKVIDLQRHKVVAKLKATTEKDPPSALAALQGWHRPRGVCVDFLFSTKSEDLPPPTRVFSARVGTSTCRAFPRRLACVVGNFGRRASLSGA